MAKIDKEYHNLLDKILQESYKYEDPNRKGVNRLEIPSYTFRHEFKDGFPAITTKKLHYKNVVTELIWFLRGDTNIKYLVDNGCNIWNKDAYNYFLKSNPTLKKSYSMTDQTIIPFEKDNELHFNLWLGNVINRTKGFGDLGLVYGHQWRNFNGVDQIERLIKNLKEKPMATDHIVNSWNVGDLENMALPPCHYGFQIVVRPLEIKERLLLSTATNLLSTEPLQLHISKLEYHNYCDRLGIPKYGFELHWQQRSVDTFLGLPFNIASYATLVLILEKITGYKALAIQGDLKKVHLYDNSLDAVKEQLSRDINKYNSGIFDAPILDEITYNSFDEFINKIQPDDITIENYESYPGIKIEMLERN